MGITLQEYREIIGGRATSAEIEARARPSVQTPAREWTQLAGGGFFGDLPFPPTVNTYYRHVGARVLISRKGRAYRKKIEEVLRGCRRIAGRVMMRVDVYPPDLRRRDLDNLLKGLQDSLTHAGLLADDSDIKCLVMEMHEPHRPDGMVRVGISRISG